MKIKAIFEVSPTDAEDVDDDAKDAVLDAFGEWLAPLVDAEQFDVEVDNPDYDEDDDNSEETIEITITVRLGYTDEA